jgi:hypothetical protein
LRREVTQEGGDDVYDDNRVAWLIVGHTAASSAAAAAAASTIEDSVVVTGSSISEVIPSP